MGKMLKNKAVIGLFIIMLGFTYIKSPRVKIEENNISDKNINENSIVYVSENN